MIGFDLSQNFMHNPQSLMRKVRHRVVPSHISLLSAEPITQAPSASQAMDQKTLRDYSALFAN